MKSFKLSAFVLLFTILASVSSFAAIRLPALVSSHMVLQRDTEVMLWGWADAKEEITINLSWSDEPFTVKANKQGEWKVEILTTTSKDAQTITLKSKDSEITLDDVLFGEVWVCSGQSNMQQPVMGYTGQPSYGYLETLLDANNSNLRLFTVDRVGSEEPLDDVEKYTPWQCANAENVASFSAVAYYYGKALQKTLDVPVGIIHTSWGGSEVRAWMSKEVLTSLGEDGITDKNRENKPHHTPTKLYNGMIHPLLSYSVKGALWYQGESDRRNPVMYEQLLPAMVNDWKELWGMEEFPFYFVQIAPYSYSTPNAFASSATNTAFMRESMERCLDLIPHSGMAVTLDLGDATTIHPPKKKPVADRLLYSALSQTYGMSVFDGKSPRYDSISIKEAKVELWFENAERGLYAYDELRDFEIAGVDKIFYPAKAKIKSHSAPCVIVSSEHVQEPVAVRYAWSNMVDGTLYDTNELPASSFRTDDWDDATQADK